jgi:UDP-N-acetylmuramate--alanine ligase
VGIKGSGMAALALVLHGLGYEVAGSDDTKHYFTEDPLVEIHIPIFPFCEDNIREGNTYIIGNAFSDQNPEVAKIKASGFPYFYYHDFIGTFFKGKRIAVSGTHGKTTTTTLLKDMFRDERICYLIGDGNGGGTPNYEYFIFEACEYKNHFLAYTPDILLINNIELDHVDFFRNIHAIFRSFNRLAQKAKAVIVCGDDRYASKIRHEHLISYGFKPRNKVRIEIADQTVDGYIIIVYYENKKYPFILPFSGRHMIYNFVAAFLASMLCGITYPKVVENINFMKLPKRRMSTRLYGKTVLVDDYGHHPTEIAATLSAIRQKYPGYLVNIIFQSHTYTRTLFFRRDFVRVLKMFDHAYVDHVFSSKRETGNNQLEKKVARAFRSFPVFTPEVLKNISRDKKEVWVFMGAGTVNEYMNLINDGNEKD